MPKASVIVPVYNTETHLRECLDSILGQTFRDVEVVCVNDGSTDGSGDILREYASRDERVRIIEQENRGLAGARNSGLDVAVGDYVLFLDSDDWYEPGTIEEVYGRCRADDAEVCVFKMRYVYVDGGTSAEADWSLRTDALPREMPFSSSDMEGNIFTVMTPSVCNKAFSMKFIAENGLRFHPELARAEDLPFTYIALSKATRITLVDRALYNYRTGQSGSLQATIHERPVAICAALALTKRDAIRAGVFEAIEHDFVNAALHQCLFTLDTVSSVSALNELLGALKGQYFSELGIEGRDESYFTVPRDYEQYRMLVDLPLDEYLHRRNRLLMDQLKASNRRLAKAKRRLGRIESSPSYRLARAMAYIPRTLARAFSRRGKGS